LAAARHTFVRVVRNKNFPSFYKEGLGEILRISKSSLALLYTGGNYINMKILNFFDKLEDKIRHHLSHVPIIYALLGILGIVLTWRGIWHLADDLNVSAPLSIIVGILILLSTGLLIAIAIGDEVIINAFRGRKKITEVDIKEVVTLAEKVDEIKNLLDRIEKRLGAIKKEGEKIEEKID